MTTESEQRESDMQALKQHVAQLMNRFDTVQIFATRHAPIERGGTVGCSEGAGNWHARYGQIARWKIIQDESARLQEARE